MVKSGKSKRRSRHSGEPAGRKSQHILMPDAVDATDSRKRHLNIIIAVLLLGFGIYQSVQFWGLAPMPHPDSPYFVRVARELLSFEVPVSFKRAPVVGLLQAGLGPLVGGQHPDLTAGILLNAILHPLNLLLLWLVGRRFLGDFAAWLAVISILNPWGLLRLTEAIAETSLLFFTLLTFYFIFKRSRWCYLFASITTMVRYEGVALIVAAFVFDMIESKTKRQRLRTLLWAVLASVPLGLWLLGTALTWDPQASHYLRLYGGNRDYNIGKCLAALWQTSVEPLFQLPFGSDESSLPVFWGLSKVVTAAAVVFAAVHSFIKRRWNLLVLLIFFVLYLLVHIGRGSYKERYYAPMAPFALIICCCALRSFWQTINGNNRVPKAIVLILQLMIMVIALVWAGSLIGFLPRFAGYSPASEYIPYITFAVMLAFVLGDLVFYKIRYLSRDIVFTSLLCLMVVSNQFTLAQSLGAKSRHDIEFKYLADWYAKNAQPGEKLLTTMAAPMRILVPTHARAFQHTAYVDSADPAAFTRDCIEKDITYVTWDSRIGHIPNNSYYKRWHIEKIRMLIEPRSLMLMESDPLRPGRPRPVAYYKFLTRVGNRYRHINIFRLYKPADAPERPVRYRLYDKDRDTISNVRE
ncbi:MAG: hypothetical protein KAJ46_00335 [Sedimentisphaerales bacterium]|nr:hypothetical protein [Sedimentisphaerales bacterium]